MKKVHLRKKKQQHRYCWYMSYRYAGHNGGLIFTHTNNWHSANISYYYVQGNSLVLYTTLHYLQYKTILCREYSKTLIFIVYIWWLIQKPHWIYDLLPKKKVFYRISILYSTTMAVTKYNLLQNLLWFTINIFQNNT